VKTIAVARISSSTHWLSDEQVRAAFEGRVSKRLAATGVEVVPVSAWDDLWRRYADDVGGVYDAQTGEADEEKFETVRDAVIPELVESRRVDAFLYVQVELVDSFGVKGKSRRSAGRTSTSTGPGDGRNPGSGQTRAVRPSDEILADPQVLDHATAVVLEAFAPSPSAPTDGR
jgi:hypothetical protein